MSQEMMRGINMLEVHVNMRGKPGVLNLTLIVDEENVILVDTGLPGQIAAVGEAMQQQAGLPLERITQIILTHHDIDHLGGVRELLSVLPGDVHVLAHTEEKAYIDGSKRPLKLAKLEDNLENLPEALKTFYPTLKHSFENATVPVDETLEHGDELPYCGGITVVFTPGHTLGHISLYVKESKTLISGDALTVQEGVLDLAPESNNHDMGLCRESMKTLTNYDIETVICYHGGQYQGNVNERIAELANKIR